MLGVMRHMEGAGERAQNYDRRHDGKRDSKPGARRVKK